MFINVKYFLLSVLVFRSLICYGDDFSVNTSNLISKINRSRVNKGFFWDAYEAYEGKYDDNGLIIDMVPMPIKYKFKRKSELCILSVWVCRELWFSSIGEKMITDAEKILNKLKNKIKNKFLSPE